MTAASLRAEATAFQPPGARALRADAAAFEPPASVLVGTLSAEAAVFEPSAAQPACGNAALRADAAVFDPFDSSLATAELRAEAAAFEPPPPGFGVNDMGAAKCGWAEAEGVQWASSPASTAAPPPSSLFSDGAEGALFPGGASVSSPWASPWGSSWGDECGGIAGPDRDVGFSLPDAHGFDAASLHGVEHQHLDMAQAFDFPALSSGASAALSRHGACGETEDEDQQFKLEGIGSLRDSLMALLDGEGEGEGADEDEDEGANGGNEDPTEDLVQQECVIQQGVANFEKSFASILDPMLPISDHTLNRQPNGRPIGKKDAFDR